MDSFEYTDFDLETLAFRLLSLRPGGGPDIYCELFQAEVQERESAISYEALSYAWGSRETTERITVNGRGLSITQNLYLALQHLRLQDEHRVLWVDAICINQANPKERGHQVQQMCDIYKQADQVIFWLGEATDETDTVIDSLRQLQENSLGYACRSWRRTDPRWFDLWITTQRHLKTEHDDLTDRQRNGLQSLLNRSWFRRVWILQEVANARVASVWCGIRSVSARFLALAPFLMDVKPDPHCQAILDIMPGPSRGDSWWNQTRDLYTLLREFGNAEASDPRDMVYALLGISSDMSTSDILRADYEKPVQDLIRDVFRFLYFVDIDPVLEERIKSMDVLLEKLRLFNNIAFEKLLASSDKRNSATLLKRGDLHLTTLLEAATVDNLCNLEELAALFQCEEQTSSIELLIKMVAEGQLIRDNKRSPLEWIATDGHENIMQLLLDIGANIESAGEDGRSLLSWAAGNGSAAATRLLIDRGADLESKDSDRGGTPLLWAAENGHEGLCKILLDRGANINAVDKLGCTSLQWATKGAHKSVVNLLLESCVNIEDKDNNGEMARWATGDGHQTIMLLLFGIDTIIKIPSLRDAFRFAAQWDGYQPIMLLRLRTKIDIHARDRIGRTPLIWAAMDNCHIAIPILLDKGAEINATRGDGCTALACAAMKGYKTVVQQLCDRGADTETITSASRITPLFMAAECGHEAVTRILLNNGADVNRNDRSGRTPLSKAAERGHEAVTRILLNKGADVNANDRVGWTPLFYAIVYNRKVIAQQLIDNGADINATASSGQTPLWCAISHLKKDLAKLLLDNGADIEARNGKGFTPLLHAVKHGNEDFVRQLLEKGADINARDVSGYTPLSWAIKIGADNIVELLKAHATMPS